MPPEATYETAFFLAARAAKTTVVCVPFMFGGPGVVMASEPGVIMVNCPQNGEARHLKRIAAWSDNYQLSQAETDRLKAVLTECAPDEIEQELVVELRGVMAARKLARMKLPTAADMRAIREAFAQGRLAVKSLPVD